MSIILNEILRLKRLEDQPSDDEYDPNDDPDLDIDDEDPDLDTDQDTSDLLEPSEVECDDDDEIPSDVEDEEFSDEDNVVKEPDMGGDEFQGQDQQNVDQGTDADLDGLEDDQQGETEPEEPEDPNRAGVIRYVKGAHLVYKRELEDGTYEEMWIYNAGKFKRDLKVRKAILAGTDIAPNATQSPDGEQQVKMWSAGNADIVVITGLPQ